MTIKIITGLFDTYDDAERAVDEIEAAGIPHRDISIVINNSDNQYTVAGKAGRSKVLKCVEASATYGGVVGGGTGLLAGLSMLVIPGVGPVLTAGWLAATVAGAEANAAVGAATGGIIGSLTNAGVNKEHARVYAEGVRRGGTLVTVRVGEHQPEAVAAIMTRYHSVDPRDSWCRVSPGRLENVRREGAALQRFRVGARTGLPGRSPPNTK